MDDITLIDEYINYHNKFVEKYGKKIVVLEQNGKFFELYATDTEGPDLSEICGLLNIIKSKKNKSINRVDRKNPYMAGVPVVSSTRHINILVQNGYTVIIIEQVTSSDSRKGVTREITEIISSGTYINGDQKPDNNYVIHLYINEEEQKNNKYLMCIGMSAIDITTGKSYINDIESTNIDDKFALDEAHRFINALNPSEIIIHYEMRENSNMDIKEVLTYLEINERNYNLKNKIDKKYLKINYQREYLNRVFKECSQIDVIDFLDLERASNARISLILLLDYLYDHNNKIIENINKPLFFYNNDYLILGNNAINQLNIIENTNDNIKINSVFSIVNNTSTNMGRRLLRDKLICPIINPDELNKIYDCNDEFISNNLYINVENHLKDISDIERLERKMSLSLIHPYELYQLYNSYKNIYDIIEIIKKTKKVKSYIPKKDIIKIFLEFIEEIEKTFILDELKKHNYKEINTNIFPKGKYNDIDLLIDQIGISNNFMDKLCITLSKLIDGKENNIVVKKNDRDGHYLYLTKRRSETLRLKLKNINEIDVDGYKLDIKKLEFRENINVVKIMLKELKELGKKSDEINELNEKLFNLNSKYYFENISKFYVKYKLMFKEISSFTSYIDLFKSNAKTSIMYNYVRPIIEKSDNSFINCEQLRHPIIERIIDFEYVPHDLHIGNDLKGILLFGLNSCGKSSLIKKLGISIIMAQAGLFVPAKKYTFSPYHYIFTRITGNDNLFKGLSSFTLEMLELRAILRRANKNTLVIGDEVCRGTEHISGNSIVAATLINLSKVNSSFIFATHLHEIANMKQIKELINVKSFHLSVSYDSNKDALIYDRIIKDGPGESIYGLTVAKYIIQDKSFMETALEIKNDLLKENNSLISGKTSKYNSQVFLYECSNCGKREEKSHITNLETHHINFQKDCDDNGFVKNKSHIKKNDKSNLAVLCNECHDKLHNNQISIEGYKMSSKGKLLVAKNNSIKK